MRPDHRPAWCVEEEEGAGQYAYLSAGAAMNLYPGYMPYDVTGAAGTWNARTVRGANIHTLPKTAVLFVMTNI
ncbi:hypothetical protein PN4B1_36100 [Paenibacillus naphthalenovorans]|nr:hypothetical protein PN4B1_36100 [Paenibacillus naphthalenovorans]